MKPTAFNYVLALGLALLVSGPSVQNYVGSIATSFYVFGIVITFIGFFGSLGAPMSATRKWGMFLLSTIFISLAIYNYTQINNMPANHFISTYHAAIKDLSEKMTEMGSYQYKGNNKDSVYFEQQSLDGLVKRVIIVQPESDQLPQKEWENINNVVMFADGVAFFFKKYQALDIGIAYRKTMDKAFSLELIFGEIYEFKETNYLDFYKLKKKNS